MKNENVGMTVGELIECLKTLDQNRIVVMSKDGEGNGYSPLSGFYEGAYEPNSTWSGSVLLEELTPELEQSGYSDEDVAGEDALPCVVLCPTN